MELIVSGRCQRSSSVSLERLGALGRPRTTYRVDPVAARRVHGIERRAAVVYAQPWLRAVQAVRAGLPGIITCRSRHRFARLTGRSDLTATALLGAGGKAAERAPGQGPPDGPAG